MQARFRLMDEADIPRSILARWSADLFSDSAFPVAALGRIPSIGTQELWLMWILLFQIVNCGTLLIEAALPFCHWSMA